MIEVTAEQIRTICTYHPDTGVFARVLRKTPFGEWVNCFRVPKSTTAYGYLQMNVNGWPYLVHRLIVLYTLGYFPLEDVDHIDGDRLNNRWSNLRLVNRQENLRNCGVRSDNTSGQVGVSFAKDRRSWHAYIGDGDERTSLGHFKTFDEAVAARRGAERILGYHTNHGARQSWRG